MKPDPIHHYASMPKIELIKRILQLEEVNQMQARKIIGMQHAVNRSRAGHEQLPH